MKFAKIVYLIAGIYGLLVILPLFIGEGYLNQQMPPAMNHPEYYYGFACVTLAWQFAFLVVWRDPARYRPLMPVTVLEKWGFFVATIVLYLLQRVSPAMFITSGIDFVLGILFIVAYLCTARQEAREVRSAA
jgi:hypothetical protein